DLQGLPGDLAPVGVVRGDQDGFRRVVDDEVHARVELEGADVAPLAADDAPLHVVRRQVHDRHRRLDSVVGREALNGRGEDLLGLDVGRLARLFLEAHGEELRLAARLPLHRREELALRLLGGEPGDRLELALLLLHRRGEAALRRVSASRAASLTRASARLWASPILRSVNHLWRTNPTTRPRIPKIASRLSQTSCISAV